MKKLTKDELNEVLRLHKLWLECKPEGVRADLSKCDLQDADLYGADLHSADLRSADLQYANLYGAYLRDANLEGANLHGAYLRDANLQGADLQGAYLSGANLSGADLHSADLYLAIVNNTNFKGTIFAGKTLLTANFGKHTAWYFGMDFIQIGCKKHSINEWLAKYEEIGKKADYTPDQIRMYGKFIKQVYKTHFKINKVSVIQKIKLFFK